MLLISTDEYRLLKHKDVVTLQCDHCLHSFQRTKREFRRDKSILKQTHYCNRQCWSASRRQRIIVACFTCGKEIERRPSSIKPDRHSFCSFSCSAKTLGSKYPKRKRKPTFCQACGRPAYKGRKYCEEHSFPHLLDWGSLTYGEIQKSGSNKNQKVREHAKYICRDLVCANCGYDKHVEVCHIKAISTYPNDALVIVINDHSNLVALCPNCHWELDRGLLPVESIPGWREKQGFGAPDSICTSVAQ